MLGCFVIPPSSLAMTSALSSTVYAMELLELPKVMPITTRSPGAGPGFLSAIDEKLTGCFTRIQDSR
jgi:hypothetical protein